MIILPEILGVTNPVPGYESNNHNNNAGRGTAALGNPQIQNAADPSRITGGDRRSEQQDAGTRGQDNVARFDSNFQNFLQRLKGTPDLATVLGRLFAGKSGTVVSSGMTGGIAEELSQFLKMLQMDQAQFVRFLSGQMSEGARFNGPLFDLLRGAYQKAESEGMRYDILQFLKKYNDYSATKHLEGNLLRNLGQMARSIPASFGSKLVDLMAKLENGIAAGDRGGNLKLLQGQILPFMSDYVSKTHDLGKARTLLTLFTLDIARYENGSEESLLQSFHLLKNYSTLREKIGSLNDQSLLTLLKNTAFARASQGSSFADQLAQAADKALRGQSGLEAQNTFQNLLSAFLVNESVYMTVNHFVIPLEWDGKMMFSELWVDPDAESDGAGGGGGERENTLRFLFKIDIESLGFFDVVLSCRGQSVDLQIYGPDKITPFSGLMQEQLSRILEDNGFQTAAVQVERMTRPLAISEVFPKLFAGKDSVNVKV